MTYATMDQVKARNSDTGQHFFDTDTLRFFRSRVSDKLYGGRFFVTSEQRGFHESDGRGYTVRVALASGSIETVGDFNDWPSREAAHGHARRCARSRVELLHDPYNEHDQGDPMTDRFEWRCWLVDARGPDGREGVPVGNRDTFVKGERLARELRS